MSSTNKNINVLRNVLKVFREATYVGVDEAMMDIFLIVAHHDDILMSDIVAQGGRPQSSTSRYMAKLSDARRIGENRSAPGLVVTYPDPLDPVGKRKRARLTPKGKDLAAKICEIISGARSGT